MFVCVGVCVCVCVREYVCVCTCISIYTWHTFNTEDPPNKGHNTITSLQKKLFQVPNVPTLLIQFKSLKREQNVCPILFRGSTVTRELLLNVYNIMCSIIKSYYNSDCSHTHLLAALSS